MDKQALKGVAGPFDKHTQTDYLNSVEVSKEDEAIMEKLFAYPYVYGNEGIQSNFPAEENEARDTYGAEVTKLATEYFYNAITGKANLDSDWDKYLSNLEAAGLNEILAYFEVVYGN